MLVIALSVLTLPLPRRLASFIPSAQAASSTIVISQFQVAGGTAADEFVELHNVGSSAFDLNGHRLVYRSAAGTSDVNVVTWTASAVIPAGGYYLLAHSTGYDGAAAANATFNTGATGTFAAAGGGLAVRHVASNAVVDSVGYGTATNAFVETAVTAVPAANDSRART
ncbi:MAG TPA: lamin tail domain-containing protein, partial [Pyrinomonadaceae bacterium]|nr:lamin tail domain-containing protein [Pyrinomonadaceae bacterium]